MNTTMRMKEMYEDITTYERALARFGDKCALLAGLGLAGIISLEQSYQEIKDMYKELEKLRKAEKETWEIPN